MSYKTRIVTIASAILLCASVGHATPNFGSSENNNRNTNKNTNYNSANAAAIAAQQQSQGQIQGQAQGQGQSQSANNHNSVSNSIETEGSVGISVGAAACTSGFSVGAPGAGAIGFSFSNKDCKIVQEAQVLWNMGMHDAARTHMTQIARVAHSVTATQPVISATTSLATRTAPPALAYTECNLINNGTQVRFVPVNAASIDLAREQCHTALGF